MKKTYVIIPMNWDYSTQKNEEIIKNYISMGVLVPSDIGYLEQVCGALIGVSKAKAMAFVKDLKNKWPFVIFNLFEGEMWGKLIFIEQF